MRRSRSILPLLGALLVLAVSCASGDEPGAAPVTPTPSTGVPGGPCPVAPVPVVVSIDQWRDLVQHLGGQCATVTTIVAGDAGDPHEFEPTPADRAAFEGARLVVANGLDYDAWAEAAARAGSPAPALVTAEAAGGAQSGDNPHLWYDPAVVDRTAGAVSDELRRLLPGAETYLDGQATAWRQELAPYTELVAAVRGRHAGRTVLATEPVVGPLARALGLTDVTPPGYASAAAEGSDPAPGDLNAVRSALRDRRADVLVVNTQTGGAVPDQLRAVAEEAGVPVIEMTESVPPGSGSFVSWQVAQLQRLDAALAGSR